MKISQENWYIDMGLKGNTKPSFSLSLPVNLLACNFPNCSPVFNWRLDVTVPRSQSCFPAWYCFLRGTRAKQGIVCKYRKYKYNTIFFSKKP